MPIFDITAEDIARLDDEQLRALIGRLCEAELRRRGYSASHVTWGGNQNAADGGIDVRVALPPDAVTDGFVPRPSTGFQAKKQDMPRGAITHEMRPGGTLRPSIEALIAEGGAYIIVSSEGSTADSALNDRRGAMAEALGDLANGRTVSLDFYDRNRVASWVRTHDGIIPWVRTMVGKPIPGWQSYGPWAADVTQDYLIDDDLKIQPGRKATDLGLSVRQGIQEIRDVLQRPRQVVRLVGLSGVGKTRLIQALFDDRLGPCSLNPDLAIYTNMADGPDPPPINLASQLIMAGTRAILVIDNCPPDLHQWLSEACRREDSQLSLLTVEYDIRDDQPEGTDVFKLESSSPELIVRLVHQRFPDVSEVDERTIAAFSGGNARIALVLAATIEQLGTLSGLSDEQLFVRLFHQRHLHDEELYLIAQACSLVYSFDGEDTCDEGELARLGRTIERTPLEVYRGVAELQRRGLVQKRGRWRAVLPHAIANRLAAVALQNVPYKVIDAQLLSSSRLLRSFSRRLGYLHTSAEAFDIVRRWLAPDGLLADVAHLKDFDRTLFENVAPVAPEEALAALERVILGKVGEEAARTCTVYLGLLRSIAYDAFLFARCVELMVVVLTAHEIDERSHGTHDFISLFHLHLSGTHAAIEQRLAVIQQLIGSADARRRTLGVLALTAALKASHFSSISSFDFGGRSRDFGYSPRTMEEEAHWYGCVLALAETVACNSSPATSDARRALAEALSGLWRIGCCPDALARVYSSVAKVRFWPEGWLSVRQALDFYGRDAPPERKNQLLAIAETLRPTDLEQKVRAIVFCSEGGANYADYEEDGDDDIHMRIRRGQALAEELGRLVAEDTVLLERLLPDTVTCERDLCRDFGRGLCSGAGDTRGLWHQLTIAMASADERLRQPLVLRGFLQFLFERDPAMASDLLDEAVEHPTHAPYYPYLQTSIPIAESDVHRLKRSLTVGRAPSSSYVYLAFGRYTDPIAPSDLRDCILTMAERPDGYGVAVEILHKRLYSARASDEDIAPELVDAGCTLLQKLSFSESDDSRDHSVGEIASTCLRGRAGALVALDLSRRLRSAVARFETSVLDHQGLLGGLFLSQPCASLSGLFDGDESGLRQGLAVLRRTQKDVLGLVADDDLLRWCDEQPSERYPAVAGAITVASRDKDSESWRWTNIALRMLERAPDPTAVLKKFVDQQIGPRIGRSASLAAILESWTNLLDGLADHQGLGKAVLLEKARLKEAIADLRQRETARDRFHDERFE